MLRHNFPGEKIASTLLTRTKTIGVEQRLSPGFVLAKKLKNWLTNREVRFRFTIMKVEIERDEKRIHTGFTPDGVFSGKVKNWIPGIGKYPSFD